MRRWSDNGRRGGGESVAQWMTVRIAHPPMAFGIPDVTTVEEALEHDVIVRHNDV